MADVDEERTPALSPEEREQRLLNQTTAFHAAIGRFAVAFEHVMLSVDSITRQLLEEKGLRDNALAALLTSGQTAGRTTRTARDVIDLCRPNPSDAENKVLEDLFKRLQKLIGDRNDVLHRTWFVGWASESDDDFSQVGSWRWKDGKFRERTGTARDFDAISDRAEELGRLFQRLHASFALQLLEPNRDFANSFEVLSDGTVIDPSLNSGPAA